MMGKTEKPAITDHAAGGRRKDERLGRHGFGSFVSGERSAAMDFRAAAELRHRCQSRFGWFKRENWFTPPD
jgi:hypothetical protein